MSTAETFTAISLHGRQVEDDLRRLRDNPELTIEERRAAIRRCYDRAIARHRELVAEFDAAAETDETEAPKQVDLNDIIRGYRQASQGEGMLAMALTPPPKPPELLEAPSWS